MFVTIVRQRTDDGRWAQLHSFQESMSSIVQETFELNDFTRLVFSETKSLLTIISGRC